MPPASATHGSSVGRMPIARWMPWMGKGLWASQRVNPASRTRTAAALSDSGPSNSASTPATSGGRWLAFGSLSGWAIVCGADVPSAAKLSIRCRAMLNCSATKSL